MQKGCAVQSTLIFSQGNVLHARCGLLPSEYFIFLSSVFISLDIQQLQPQILFHGDSIKSHPLCPVYTTLIRVPQFLPKVASFQLLLGGISCLHGQESTAATRVSEEPVPPSHGRVAHE